MGKWFSCSRPIISLCRITFVGDSYVGIPIIFQRDKMTFRMTTELMVLTWLFKFAMLHSLLEQKNITQKKAPTNLPIPISKAGKRKEIPSGMENQHAIFKGELESCMIYIYSAIHCFDCLPFSKYFQACDLYIL